MRFLKEGYKTAAMAIVSLVKNRWFGNGHMNALSIPSEKLDLSNTIDIPGTACGVNTRSALQIKAKI